MLNFIKLYRLIEKQLDQVDKSIFWNSLSSQNTSQLGKVKLLLIDDNKASESE